MADRKTILVTRRLPPDVEARAARDYDAKLNPDDKIMTADEIIAAADGAEAILCLLSDKFPRAVIEALPDSVRVISTFSVGTEHIDLDAAKERGIRVGFTPVPVVVPTAEIAMLLILGSARRAPEGIRMIAEQRWPGWQPMQLLGQGLRGRKLGILGMGNVGRTLAGFARAFGMEIHYHDLARLPEDLEQGATYHATTDELFAVSEVLSLNAPSTPKTRGILNAETIAKLPEGVIVVNTARGDLVVDDDLIAALRSGRVAYAGLDVFTGEPKHHPGYLELENVFLLPHLGSATVGARNDMGFNALDNIDAVLQGREPPFAVA